MEGLKLPDGDTMLELYIGGGDCSGRLMKRLNNPNLRLSTEPWYKLGFGVAVDDYAKDGGQAVV